MTLLIFNRITSSYITELATYHGASLEALEFYSLTRNNEITSLLEFTSLQHLLLANVKFSGMKHSIATPFIANSWHVFRILYLQNTEMCIVILLYYRTSRASTVTTLHGSNFGKLQCIKTEHNIKWFTDTKLFRMHSLFNNTNNWHQHSQCTHTENHML